MEKNAKAMSGLCESMKSKNFEKGLTEILSSCCICAITCFFYFHLFSPVFDFELLMYGQTQPVSFFQNYHDDMYILSSFMKQLFGIITNFTAGQVLILIVPFYMEPIINDVTRQCVHIAICAIRGKQ